MIYPDSFITREKTKNILNNKSFKLFKTWIFLQLYREYNSQIQIKNKLNK